MPRLDQPWSLKALWSVLGQWGPAILSRHTPLRLHAGNGGPSLSPKCLAAHGLCTRPVIRTASLPRLPVYSCNALLPMYLLSAPGLSEISCCKWPLTGLLSGPWVPRCSRCPGFRARVAHKLLSYRVPSTASLTHGLYLGSSSCPLSVIGAQRS